MIFLLTNAVPGRESARGDAEIQREGARMAGKKKKSKTLREELVELLEQDDHRRQMLLAVVEKAIGGDMKAFETIREILDEKSPGDGAGVTVTLGKGVEELAG